MFEDYLQSITDMKPKYKEFAVQLLAYVEKSINEDKPLYATHGFCTDGGVAGTMIRYARPEAAIIPVDYWILNHPLVNNQLEELPWVGIVDLKPFNRKTAEFWVDHHISAMDQQINAKKIRFDMDGDSGAYQLLLSDFLGPLPLHITELAIMTRTTDTAGYITPPPIDTITTLTDLDLTTTEGEEGRKQNERRIWLLDDAFGSVTSLKEIFDMYNYLAKDGFYGISKVLDRVNNHREHRKQAYDIANAMDIAGDIIAFSFNEDTVDKFTILRVLQDRGAKIVVSLSKSKNHGVKVSFRRNRFLSDEENSKYQLHKLAEQVGGGGHPGASGATVESVEEVLSHIQNWGKDLGLKTKFHEL